MPESSTGVGRVVDPTKNVLDLVEAESKYQDAMRDAETRRVNDLATLRERYEMRLAELSERNAIRTAESLQHQTESTATQLSTQFDRMATALGDRITDLEKKSWETGGRTSVSDPAIAKALNSLHELMVAGGKVEARGTGRGEVIAWIVTGIAAISAVATVVISAMR